MALIDGIPSLWGTGVLLSANAPDPPDGVDALRAAGRFERHASTPAVAAAIMRANVDIDVRDVLPTIDVPTLVLHCDRDPFISVEHSRYLAEHIPGARYVEVPGEFHVTWRPERYEPILEAIEEFLTGTTQVREPDRVLRTILFTDIVDSTSTAARLGDARWREVLDAHDAAVRREIARFRGTEVSTTGDGFLVSFDGPATAIRCAHTIIDAVAAMGVHVRAGIHTGECELRGDDLAGRRPHRRPGVGHGGGGRGRRVEHGARSGGRLQPRVRGPWPARPQGRARDLAAAAVGTALEVIRLSKRESVPAGRHACTGSLRLEGPPRRGPEVWSASTAPVHVPQEGQRRQTRHVSTAPTSIEAYAAVPLAP